MEKRKRPWKLHVKYMPLWARILFAPWYGLWFAVIIWAGIDAVIELPEEATNAKTD